LPEESAAPQVTERSRFSPTVIRGDFRGSLPGTPVAQDVEAVDLPLYGRIAAGTPIEALRDQSTTVGVPGSLLGCGGEHYALEVAGDSMIEAGILDGDTVIIQRCDTADNGSVVVALVDNEEVTLKRLRRRGASIALEPANKAFETRIFGPDRVKVQGRLVGLMRRF
jgi:repressor LexA